MSMTEIATDLLTPLGAYLRLRVGLGLEAPSAKATTPRPQIGRPGRPGPGTFLLESVERGRLGRHSFVGRGSRLVSFDEAEALGEPVVGYLGYDAVARLEPMVRLPADGPDWSESVFVVPDVLVRFDHARGVAEVLLGETDWLDRRGRGRPGRPLRDHDLEHVSLPDVLLRPLDPAQVLVACG